MDTNIIKFDFVKKALIENAVAAKSPTLIRKAIDFSKSVLVKVTFKVKSKQVITNKITITPTYVKNAVYDGVGYTIKIDRGPYGYSPGFIWYKLDSRGRCSKGTSGRICFRN